MGTATTDFSELAILDELRGTRDALSVRRVFGDPCTIDGITIIPVARIAGGTGPDESGGHGFGTEPGLGARPVGVYRVKDGELTWKPAIDIDRLARGTQVLAGIATVCVTLVALRRRP